MNIIGPDQLVFGVDDVEACEKCLADYGLDPVGSGEYAALDGTSILIRPRDDETLPAGLETSTMLRKTVYGVADDATLDQVAAELGKDREVKRLADGSLESVDDLGFALGFRVTVRRALQLPGEMVNSPGAPVQRPENVIGCDPSMEARPRTLSHVVYFVPDAKKGEAFYADRLGFVTTDRFTNAGPFMRPAGTNEHHTLFMIQTPPFMQGCEHFTFHMGGPTEVMLTGSRFVERGYESFWGPGRHLLGSNWFWYFDTPLGCHIEYDADMDLHDDAWVARAVELSADASQLFLFKYREKWAPTGPPK